MTFSVAFFPFHFTKKKNMRKNGNTVVFTYFIHTYAHTVPTFMFFVHTKSKILCGKAEIVIFFRKQKKMKIELLFFLKFEMMHACTHIHIYAIVNSKQLIWHKHCWCTHTHNFQCEYVLFVVYNFNFQ